MRLTGLQTFARKTFGRHNWDVWEKNVGRLGDDVEQYRPNITNYSVNIGLET